MSQVLEAKDAQPVVTRPKARYSDRFKAQALLMVDLCKGNISEAARKLEISDDTLYGWVKNNSGIHPEVLEIKDAVKRPLADEFERNAFLFLERASDPQAIKETSAYYAQIAATDAAKSSLLLRGQPTSILGVMNSKNAILAEIQAKYGISAERAAEIAGEVFSDLDANQPGAEPSE